MSKLDPGNAGKLQATLNSDALRPPHPRDEGAG